MNENHMRRELASNPPVIPAGDQYSSRAQRPRKTWPIRRSTLEGSILDAILRSAPHAEATPSGSGSIFRGRCPRLLPCALTGHERTVRAITAATLLIALSLALPATAQQIGQNTPTAAKETPTISVSTQLVVEAVVVKDKKGNSISGLSAKDFSITEDARRRPSAFASTSDSRRAPHLRRPRRLSILPSTINWPALASLPKPQANLDIKTAGCWRCTSI